jgi:hypothetical protein
LRYVNSPTFSSGGIIDRKASLSEISARLTEAQADAKAAANPTEPAPLPPIKKVSWAQVGRVAEPGRYMFRFGWLTITAEDLAVWEQHPSAVFTLFRTATVTEEVGDEFRLGTFELRENISLSEKWNAE